MTSALKFKNVHEILPKEIQWITANTNSIFLSIYATVRVGDIPIDMNVVMNTYRLNAFLNIAV